LVREFRILHNFFIKDIAPLSIDYLIEQINEISMNYDYNNKDNQYLKIGGPSIPRKYKKFHNFTKRFISLKMKLTQENSKLETKCRKLVDIFPDGKSVDSKLSECVNFCFPNFSFGKQFEKKETTIKKAIQ